MTLSGEYEPSTQQWVRDQVEAYESSGGERGNTLRDTGLPVIIVTSIGAKSGKLRKTPLMRVEHGGKYALVGSQGGAPKHPTWFYNLLKNPRIDLQDGPTPRPMTARLIEGDERTEWWERAVDAYPNYALYQERADRTIPVFLAEPISGE